MERPSININSPARRSHLPVWLSKLILCSLAAFFAAGSSAQESIPGRAGVATWRDAANFSELAGQEALQPARTPKQAKRSVRIPKRPKTALVPNGATTGGAKLLQATAQSSSLMTASVQSSSTPSPSLSASFSALGDDGTQRTPNTQGAVGPNHLMVALNSQVSIQNRAGVPLSTLSLEGWWASFGASNVLNPRLLYDPFGQRWIFAAVGDRDTFSGTLVAVSQTTDPTGDWNRYFISADPLSADTPSVGFNTNRIVVQITTFDPVSSSPGSRIYALNKANLYAGGAGLYTSFDATSDLGDIQVPAVTLDRNYATNYLVGSYNGNYSDDGVNFFGYLRIFSISGPVGSEVFNFTDSSGSPGPYAVTASPWASTAPTDLDGVPLNFLPQLGSTNLIDAGDDRLINVVFRNSTLWAAHTVFLPAGTNTPTHSAAQWWEITPGGGVFQLGRIEDPGGGLFYAYPSIGVNSNDDAVVGYSRFSASAYPGAEYSFHIGPNLNSTVLAGTELKAGEAPCSFSQWGNWSATVVDPLNDADFWTIQEYAATPVNGSDRWGTWWGRMAPPVDLALTVTNSPSPVPLGASTTYTLVVTNASTNRVTLASGVKTIDTLPAGVNFVSASSSQGSCSFANGVVNCDLGDLPARGRATVSMVVTPTAVGLITNIATVLGNGQDVNLTNNTVVSVTNVIPSADLAVLLSDSPDPVTQNSNLTYTVLVTNRGPMTADQVRLTNTLPSSVTFISANSTQGTNTRSGNVITFTLGSLASGSSASATIVVGTPTAGMITNRATVTSTTADIVAANNSTSVISRVNAPPTIQSILSRTISEDGTDTFTFTISDLETPAANLIVTPTSSNPALIPNANLVITGGSSPRTLSISPLPNQFGSSVLTLTVTDSDGVSAKTTWTETVTAVNDRPTLDSIDDLAFDEDSGAHLVELTGISTGAPNESDTLTVTATSSNPAIVPNPVVSYASPNATGMLTVIPATNQFGTVTITVTVNDNQLANNIVTRTFMVTVNPINDPPALNAIANLNTNEDAAQQTVALSGITSGASNEPDVLSVSASSSDPSIVPNPSIAYTSPNSTGTLTFTPVPTRFGTATITVTVNDNRPSNNIVTRSFTVTVNPVNDSPTLNTIANLSINEDAPEQTVNLSGISTGATNEFDSLTISAVSSSPSLIPTPSVNYTSPDGTGTLTFTPVPTRFGTATITVTVNDNQPSNNIVTRSFTVTVNSVNDPPTLDPINDLSIGEDSGQRTVNLTGISSGATNEADLLTATAVSDNTSVIPNPSVTYASPASTGSLRFTPATNAFGTAMVMVTVNDGQPSNNIVRQTFMVTVAPVNDAPTLNAIGNVTINEDAPTQTVSLSGITSGAANEPEFLTVTATSSNPGIIPDPVAHYTNGNSTGTLTFAPTPDSFGSNIVVTVTINDGQPSNNIVTRTFTVTVNPVNDPPTLNPIGDIVIDEDASPQSINLSGISSGAANEFQTLSVTASNSNPALLTSVAVNYTSPATVGTLSFTTVPNANGMAIITVTVNDNGGSSNTVRQSFKVTVNSINDLPNISVFPDPVVTDEDVPITIPFTVSDVETPVANLSLTGDSSAPDELISNDGITFGGSGANRTVTLRPLTNAFGSATITIRVTDANGGFSEAMFGLEINPVNDPPAIIGLTNVVTTEDTPVIASFTLDDAESLADDLTVSVSSSNQFVVANANLSLGGSGANRTLTITPASHAFGTSIITVTADDGAPFNNISSRSFTFTVNGLPIISAIADMGIAEDTASAPIPFIIGDPETPAASLTLSGSSSNPALIPMAGITFGGSGSNRTVILKPLTNQVGAALITITVTDGSGSTSASSFNVVVNRVNDSPTISAISNQSINEDTPSPAIAFTVGDPETPAGALTLAGASSNPVLVPNGNIQFGGSGSSRTVTITPAANQAGSATITVTVRDSDGLAASSSFLLTVNAINDPPSISSIADQTTNEDAPLAIPFTVGDVDTVPTSLTLSANSSNPAVVPVPSIVFAGSGANRIATITPASNQSGAAVITINVSDGAAITSTSFNLTVSPVNDLPTISSILNQAINEDTRSAAIAFTVGDVETPAANLSVTASSSNQGLVPNANLLLGGSGGSRTLTITPATNQFGTATISISVTDADGGTASNRFLLTVNPVNDPPTIASIPNQNVSEDSPIAVPFTVGDLDSPVNSLTVTATSTNATLVPAANIVLDGYGANRTAIITPASNQVGTTAITLTVSDGALTASTSFVLTVGSINDLPTLDAIPDLFTNVSPGVVTVNLTGITSGAVNENQALAVTATFTNPGLFVNTPVANYTSPSTIGTVTFKPSNQNVVGSSIITVTVSDGTSTFSRSFTVNIKAAATTAPTITAVAGQTISEDTSTAALAFTIGDAQTPVSLLKLTAASSNPTLVPTNNIVFGGSGSNRTVTVTPAPNLFGVATISLTVANTNYGGARTSFSVTVNSVNDLPIISAIPNQTINEDTSTGLIPFMVGDVETAAGSLTVSGTSSNLTLVPNANIVFGGSGTNRALIVTPATNQSGMTLITVTVNDGTGTRSTNFVLTVNPAQDLPTISAIADQTINEDTPSAAIPFTVGDLETAAGSLTVAASSSNEALVPNANITPGGSGASRTVTILPAANQYGTTTITLTVSDGMATASTSFLLTVNPVNDPPTLDTIAPVFINQGAGLQMIDLAGIAAGPPNESQALAVSAISSNPGIIPNPVVSYTSPNSFGSLSFTPVPGTNGSATITVTVNDGQSANNLVSRTFTVTVNAAPLLSSITDRVTSEGTPSGPIAFTVSDAETPAAMLSITFNSSNTGLVPNGNIALGGSGTNRTLTITPASKQFGFTTITVSVADADGNNTSKSFVLIVTPVNDPPTLDVLSDLLIDPSPHIVPLSGITAGGASENQALFVSARSSNPGVVPDPTVHYSSPNSSGYLSLAPLADGVATITVTVFDGGIQNNNISRSFAVTVSSGVPRLTIAAAAGNMVMVSWSTNLTGYVLQGNDSASGAGVWNTVPNNPVIAGNHFVVTISAAEASRYYRLMK